jgi:hypothetical protein
LTCGTHLFGNLGRETTKCLTTTLAVATDVDMKSALAIPAMGLGHETG